MILKKREKILAWATVAVLAVVVLQYAYSSLRGPSGKWESHRLKLAMEVQRKKNQVNNATLAAEKLKKRRRQSLPADTQLAQSLYERWLRQCATDAEFSDTKINFVSKQSAKDVYYALRFSLHTKATLNQLTKFLYDFYRAGYLHQIVSLTAIPRDTSSSLTIQMTIDTLALKDALTTDKLADATSQRKLATLDVYREKIAGRNLFAHYEPPRPPETTPVDTVDPLKYTELNSVVWVGSRPEVWINAKMTGKRYELTEGDEFEIGETKCKVLRIGDRDALIEIDGEPFLVPYGKSLRDGNPLPPTPGPNVPPADVPTADEVQSSEAIKTNEKTPR